MLNVVYSQFSYKFSFNLLISGCFLLLLSFNANAQVLAIPEGLKPEALSTTLDTTLTDSLARSSLADSLAQQKKPDIAIFPWPNILKAGQRIVATDSLIRWQYVSDVVDIMALENAALPSRSGIQMRSDAFIRGTNTTRFQQLNWEGIPMDEPLSGTPMYEMLPVNKLAQLKLQQQNGVNTTTFTNRTYQVTEPWSSLYFDEADGEYQNLAFSLTRNFSRKHNAELGYRQVRDGSLFRLSESEGNQIFLQNTYDLTQKIQLTQRWFSNQTQVDEPFGYSFVDAAAFSFNPFSSAPNQNSRQVLDLSMHSFGIKLRTDSVAAAHTHIQLYRKSISRAISTAQDTVDYTVNELGITASNRFQLPKNAGKINSEARLRVFRPEGQVLSAGINQNWMEAMASSQWQKPTNNFGNLTAGVEFGYTNPTENFATYAITTGIFDLPIQAVGKFSATIYQRSDAPNWIELQSPTTDLPTSRLKTFQSRGIDLQLDKNFGESWRLSATAGYKQVQDLPKIGSQYLNNADAGIWSTLQNMAGSMAIKWKNDSFYAKYQADYFRISEQNGIYMDQRLLSTSQIGWKNYAFNKATFLDISAELRNELLPFYGLARDPLTHLWQLQNTDQIPAYTSVLDLRISARLRSIMVMVRYENAFDAVTQLGYFETIGYPAPARRLLFSVRALFKN